MLINAEFVDLDAAGRQVSTTTSTRRMQPVNLLPEFKKLIDKLYRNFLATFVLPMYVIGILISRRLSSPYI